jgi:LmbE family N-acetylglucosaminyl deacetylase
MSLLAERRSRSCAIILRWWPTTRHERVVLECALTRSCLTALLLLTAVACVGCVQRTSAGPFDDATPGSVMVYAVAHPDDWQLFVGDRVIQDVASGRRVMFLYVTSGGADLPAAYWQARERGAHASTQVAASVVPEHAEGVDAACDDVQIRNHRIRRCVVGSTVSYHLRLPDGNLDGTGFASTGFHSLAKLQSHGRSHLEAVDGSSEYSGWADLRDTVRDAMVAEGGGSAARPFAVHTHDPESSRNRGDHSDHVTTGSLVTEAIRDLPVSLTYFAGYDVVKRPANLLVQDAASKAVLFLAYDRQRGLADPLWSAYGRAPDYYYPFFFRTYTRTVSIARADRGAIRTTGTE